MTTGGDVRSAIGPPMTLGVATLPVCRPHTHKNVEIIFVAIPPNFPTENLSEVHLLLKFPLDFLNFSELQRKIIILLKNKTERAESKLLKIGKFVSTSCLHTLASFVPILMTYILTMFAETLQRKRKLANTNAQRNSTNKGQRAVHFIWSFRERHLYCVEPERWKADSLKSTRPDKQSGLLALNSNLLIISGSRFQLSRNAACFSSTEKETSILFPKLFLLSPLQHRSYTEENWANEKSVSFFACVSSRSRFFETQCSSLILCKTENPWR